MKSYKDNSVVVKSEVSRVRTWTTLNSRPAETAECSECRIACNTVSLTGERIWRTVVHEHRSAYEANKTTMIKTMSLSYEICRNFPLISTIPGLYCFIIIISSVFFYLSNPSFWSSLSFKGRILYNANILNFTTILHDNSIEHQSSFVDTWAVDVVKAFPKNEWQLNVSVKAFSSI